MKLAAEDHPAVTCGRFHVLAEARGGFRGIDRAHEHVALLGVAHLELLRKPGEAGNELVTDRRLDIDHGAGAALLSLQAKRRSRNALCGSVEVGLGRHIGGVLAAHFSDDELRGRRAGQCAEDGHPRRVRARKRDAGNDRLRHE